jgi:hypothetical protein
MENIKLYLNRCLAQGHRTAKATSSRLLDRNNEKTKSQKLEIRSIRKSIQISKPKIFFVIPFSHIKTLTVNDNNNKNNTKNDRKAEAKIERTEVKSFEQAMLLVTKEIENKKVNHKTKILGLQ